MNNIPLAELLRPHVLSEVVGQAHILGPGKLLTRIVDSGRVPNLIFYGPSGIGKTTVANIIAEKTMRTFRKLNATTAGTADIKDIIAARDTLLAPNGILLYLDEIQYFNKKQQQTLLEYIEDGSITLIASTTENPYFSVYNAILSRSTIFEFKPLTPGDIAAALKRAISVLEAQSGLKAAYSPELLEKLARGSGGDCRKALNALDILFSAGAIDNDTITLSGSDAELVSQRSAMRYDRDGDEHFDVLSALQKSIRGSDADAALHYLARLLEAGNILSACRRLLVIAAEDIGLAYPQAIAIVKACCDTARELGLPEAQLPLAEAVLLLATAPKSNNTWAISAAREDIRGGKSGGIPRNLQNVHADGADKPRKDDMQGYKYPHDFPGHWVAQQYLPDELLGTKYYEPGDNKFEQAALKYWRSIKNENIN
ncbi:MAG: replication-associated recombination protein A [Oscillospiraceae bacterium]|jgi:putative ATPase|nr:replication-associated recombination protein A [Oscillospiraceae bacterium]